MAKDSDTVELFNTSSSQVGIMLENGTIVMFPPFSVIGTPIPRASYEVWKKTVVGQAYMDKCILSTVKSDKVGFASTSTLEVPPELKAMPTAGATEATIEQKPKLDGGTVLLVG
jgi:hypothetical protein